MDTLEEKLLKIAQDRVGRRGVVKGIKLEVEWASKKTIQEIDLEEKTKKEKWYADDKEQELREEMRKFVNSRIGTNKEVLQAAQAKFGMIPNLARFPHPLNEKCHSTPSKDFLMCFFP